MIKKMNIKTNLYIYIAVILLQGVLRETYSLASPPACHRSDAGKFLLADAVAEAKVIKSKRWSEGHSTLHLVAKYRVEGVFKGDVEKNSVLIVTHTCLDKPIPERVMGYPGVMNYCPGGNGLNLIGVNSIDGGIIKKEGNNPYWIVFLRKDIRKGAPQQTWLEVSDTGFGVGCDYYHSHRPYPLPENLRSGFDRMMERKKSIKQE